MTVLMQKPEKLQLTTGRQGRFGLIKEIQPRNRDSAGFAQAESSREKREKGLAVRLAVQGSAAVKSIYAEPIYFRYDIVEALGAKEVTVRRQSCATQTKKILEPRMRSARFEIEVGTTSLGIEIASNRESLDQCGFPGAVLADEKSNSGMEWQK